MTKKTTITAQTTAAVTSDAQVLDLMARLDQRRDQLGDPGDQAGMNARLRVLQERDRLAGLRGAVGETWALYRRKRDNLASLAGRIVDAGHDLAKAQAAFDEDVRSGRLAPTPEQRATKLVRSFTEDQLNACTREIGRLQMLSATVADEVTAIATRFERACREAEAVLHDGEAV